MIYALHKKTDQNGESIHGVLSVDQKNQDAHFFDESGIRVIAELRRARIEWAGEAVLCLSGMEPVGYDKKGSETFRHQVWYLTYTDSKK